MRGIHKVPMPEDPTVLGIGEEKLGGGAIVIRELKPWPLKRQCAPVLCTVIRAEQKKWRILFGPDGIR